MITRLHPRILVVATLFAAFTAPSIALDAAQESALQEKAASLAGDFPGIAVVVSRDGETAWSFARGFADRESETPATPDTLFNVYSVSKALTGMAFLSLVHESGLDIDRSARSIDPQLPPVFEGVTLRHLLTHSSGIRHYDGSRDWRRFAALRCDAPLDAVEYFSGDKLEFAPGEDTLYTTFGMALASHLLVELTGTKSYEEAINARLGLSRGLMLDGDEVDKAVGYWTKRRKLVPVEDLNAQCKFGGGGLLASARQLAESGEALYAGRILPLDEARVLLTEPGGSLSRFRYGMATVEVDDGEGGKRLLAGMGGGSPGGRGYLLVDLDAGIAVGIAANREGETDKVASFAFEVVSLLAAK